ncbi:LysR family transcriptional regulator [Methyloceanibacter methanicus]|uniref:LysR family transcriptional regulator n=1 Tax=Methyloceanibacter methanicus TaxID=1774968 RepID=A0A1E3W0A1_9HYPH|nr:hydrogen peroxide-inducible genes activator [Methyloceanibacter methanicus]ODR98576.1 LysR family transcriptional regulator [Methyloceanibacter methanicus]
MVSFRQLRYLEALARTRHFGRAARDCAVSQPALSMQIKDLEDELKLKLVERRKSGIGLTDKGIEVAGRARTILASVQDLVDYAKGQEGMLTGVLKLGAIPSIAPYLLPAALPVLQARFPDLSLRLRETVTETLVRELVSGDLDVILVALPIDDPAVETHFLFDDAFILATKATPDNAGIESATQDMLAQGRLLLLEEGHCLREQALSYCHLMAPDLRQSFGASSLATIMQMVANGYGITLLPEMASSIEVHRGDEIRLLRFAEPRPKREVGLAWRKSSPRKAEFMQLGTLLCQAAPPHSDPVATQGRKGDRKS